jgi:PAS domain S-box-containing protein
MEVPTSHTPDYRRILDLLSDLVLVLDSQGTVIAVNASAETVLGVHVEKGSHTLRDLLPAAEQRLCEQILQDGPDRPAVETRLYTRDKTELDVSIEVHQLVPGSNDFLVVFARDITQQKQRDLDFLRFSNVIHHTINPIQITDANGMMVYVNPAFERVTGFSREELIGKNPRILNSGKHSTEFWRGVWKSISDGNVWVGRVENLHKNGSPLYWELVISPIVDNRGRIAGYLGAHRDITKENMLERQLVRSQRMESIGTLAAGIAHEVGNPLTAISSLVQVIQRTNADAFAKEKLELINSQVNRIARIIRELVDFSRPSTHVTKPTEINRVIREALNIVQYGKKVKDIAFAIDLAPDLPDIQIVPDQAVQVFINILMNAVDSLEGKKGTIMVSSSVDDERVWVKVKDSGKGIEPADREKIFEPFYTTKATGQGTGLGLWVSYGIVKSFGGEVYVESEPQRGSTFTISFPRKGS